MLDAFIQPLSNIAALIFIGLVGWYVADKGLADDHGRRLVSKIVNLAIPFMLFYAMTSKFTHDQLVELLKMGFLPFVVIGLNHVVARLFVRFGLVTKEVSGVFTACFSGGSIMFVGMPVTMALFGDVGIPYLLVYFFANVLYIWTVGLYEVQMDGVARTGAEKPRFFSVKSAKMVMSPPLMGFVIAVACILLSVPVPLVATSTAKLFGQVATPLAIIFIGMTIQKVGFERMKHLPKDVWLVLFGGYVVRPLLMYLCAMPFDMDPVMRKVFVMAAMLPCSAVIAVISKQYGADDEFASETIGASTIALIFWLPMMFLAVHFA